MSSGAPLLPAFATPAGHAHELLFGFALAVVAGYLVKRVSGRRLTRLFVLWLLARGSYLLLPGSAPAATWKRGAAAHRRRALDRHDPGCRDGSPYPALARPPAVSRYWPPLSVLCGCCAGVSRPRRGGRTSGA